MKIKVRKLLVAGVAAATILVCGCGDDQDSFVFTNGNNVVANQPNNPNNPGNATVAQLNQQGLQTLNNAPTLANLLAAREFFRQAVARIEAGTQPRLVLAQTTQNERDTAYFFFALTRVAALPADIQSDGSASELDRVGDFLDALGYAADPRTSYGSLVRPTTFNTGVTGESVRQYLLGSYRTELEGAIANLGEVSQSFTSTLVVPDVAPGHSAFPAGSTTVEVDYGDVLAFRSGFRLALGSGLVLASYDLGGDAAQVLNDANRTVQSILQQNPTGGTHEDTSLLTAARTVIDAGLADLESATDFIQAETDAQNDDLINIAAPQARVNTFLTRLDQAQLATTSTVTVTSRGGQSTASLSLQNFFDADGFSLRANLPPITADMATGPFPGTPFGDIYHNYTAQSLSDPNRDVSPMNGIPDILE